MANRLPGMNDAQIEELEEVAKDYKKLQVKRMRLLAAEVEQKGKLLDVMKKHKRKTYKYEDIEIEIVPTGERIKVKIAKDDAEDDQDAA